MAASRRSLFGLVLLVLAISGGSQWLYGHHEAQLGEALAAKAMPGDIRVLSSESCDYCTIASSWLRQHRVPYEECVVEHDAKCAATFNALQAPGTPVILVRGQPQLGFDPARILGALG